MKKLTAISFLLVIFFNQIGYYFYYGYQQYRIRRDIRHALVTNLPESELEIIIAEEWPRQIHWEEEGEEFQLNGEMYDVARIELKDGKHILHCINDKKEKKLLDHFIRTIRDNHDDARKQGRSSGKGMVKCQLTDFEQPLTEIFSGISTFSRPQYACIATPLTSSVQEIKGPPPKV